MTDHHDTQCPVMEIGCHSVGGYSMHHDRGRAGDCRCGKKCECALIVRVRAEEREKKMAAADIVFVENIGLAMRLERVREHTKTLLKHARAEHVDAVNKSLIYAMGISAGEVNAAEYILRVLNEKEPPEEEPHSHERAGCEWIKDEERYDCERY